MFGRSCCSLLVPLLQLVRPPLGRHKSFLPQIKYPMACWTLQVLSDQCLENNLNNLRKRGGGHELTVKIDLHCQGSCKFGYLDYLKATSFTIFSNSSAQWCQLEDIVPITLSFSVQAFNLVAADMPIFASNKKGLLKVWSSSIAYLIANLPT